MRDRGTRVCLVSEDLSLPADEGLKKFVCSIIGPMSERVNLLAVSTGPNGSLMPGVSRVRANRLMVGREMARMLRSFCPQAIVYVPRAAGTRNSFLRAAVLRRYAPDARHMMISLQPRRYGPLARTLIRSFHPDVFAIQDSVVDSRLALMGLMPVSIPSGVDTRLFQVVAPAEKARLRRKYGVDRDAYVVLHVGHLKRERNVLLLARACRELQVDGMVVGSTSTRAHAGVSQTLRAQGVRVIDSHVGDIAEVYQIADCYLFPVHASDNAIGMPLSVLEAMACGIPVVATRFGALPTWLPSGPGITYADDDDGLIRELARLRQEGADSPEMMRDRVQPFSWQGVADRILGSLSIGRPGYEDGQASTSLPGSGSPQVEEQTSPSSLRAG